MIFGQFFNRHETWAEMARPWIDYLSRNSLMLQQGRYFADVAYFYGEEGAADRPLQPQADRRRAAALRLRFINADALTSLVSVTDGDLTAKSGARYRVLYLGGSSRKMSLPVLRGSPPWPRRARRSSARLRRARPSLEEDAAEYAALVRRLWGGGPTTTVGKGRVIDGTDVEKALASIGVAPRLPDERRRRQRDPVPAPALEDGDVYFLNNRKPRAENVEARFRVTGKEPEIWRADTGETEAVSYRIEGGETVVPLEIGPEDSFFVVFRKPTSAGSRTVARPAFKVASTLGQPWAVAFQPGRGAPASITLQAPRSLSESTEAGVKYFSGVSTWTSSSTRPGSGRWGTAPARPGPGR